MPRSLEGDAELITATPTLVVIHGAVAASIGAANLAMACLEKKYPTNGIPPTDDTNLYKCAWQESNLLPFGPEPNALSGELQAR